VATRLRRAIEDIERSLDEVSGQKTNNIVHALFALLKTRGQTEALLEDVRLLGALTSKDPLLDRYRALIRRIETVGRTIVSAGTYSLSITAPDTTVRDRLRGATRDMLGKWGFVETQGKDPALRLTMAVDVKRLGEEQHGGRTEFLYGAVGEAHLFERAGEWTELAATLPDGRYTELHANEAEAKRRAINAAADTLLSIFRSLLRGAAE